MQVAKHTIIGINLAVAKTKVKEDIIIILTPAEAHNLYIMATLSNINTETQKALRAELRAKLSEVL